MKKFYLVFLFVFVSTVLFSQNIISERIFDIEVEGNNFTSKEFIINRSGIYIGSPLTDKDIENGIKNLFSTGFFQQVEIT
ncbi:MAG: POTRA domain-containing protein, partial [candidate division WOR-3 bacterium]